MPTPAGGEHLRKIGAEPRLLVHVQGLRFADKGGTFLGVEYRPNIKAVSAISSEWAAGDLGVVSNITINFNDGDHFMLDLSNNFQFELTTCEVFHYFIGEAAKVLIFKGTIVSPVGFSDSDKTFTFSVANIVTGTPLGFAPTLEEIPTLADEAVGQPWPIVFGSPRKSPAILVTRPVIGRLKEETASTAKVLRIENGDKFPQDEVLEIRVGDEIVKGKFKKTVFTVATTAYAYPENPRFIVNPQQIVHDGWNSDAYANIGVKGMNDFIGQDNKRFKDPAANVIFIPKADGQARRIDVLGMVCYITDTGNEPFSWAIVTKVIQDPAYGDFQRVELGRNLAKMLKTGDPVSFCAGIRKGWTNRNEEIRVHSGGTPVSVWKSDDPEEIQTVYVANTFGTISLDAVYTQRTVKDSNSNPVIPHQVIVDPESYTVEIASDEFEINWPGGQQQPILPTLIKFISPPIHQMDDPDDPLFVDIVSVISASSADALKFILEDWAGLDINQASFGQTNESTQFTPSHFTITEIIDVLDLAKNIAWQSRSALIVKLGEIFMKYLPVATIVDLITIPADDFNLVEGSCRVAHTDMADIVTQFKATFAPNGADRENNNIATLTISNNLAKYGLTEEEVDMFIYDNFDSVLLTLEWWLKQKSFIWKEFHGRAFLDLMEIEPLDYVLIVSDLLPETLGPHPARIDSLAFNAQEDSVTFVGWTGIPSGTSNFDPTIISDTVEPPTEEEEEEEEEEDPDDKAPPATARRHKDQDQANEDQRAEHGGHVYFVFGVVKTIVPDEQGKYHAAIYESGKPEDFDDDEKSTLNSGEGNFRLVPLQVIGTQRPTLNEHIMIKVTPMGYFYHQPVVRYQ